MFDICKRYNEIETLDLSKIIYTSDDNGLPVLNYDNIPLDNIDFIYGGSFGKVYMYSNGKYKIAVKVYNYDDDMEFELIEYLNDKYINCNTINIKILEANSNKISVMDLMNDSLDKLKGSLDMNNIFKIISNIANDLSCLNKNNLSYTDLKCANILFKCTDNKYITTVLGDIGSICIKGQKHIASYPPIEFKRKPTKVECNESSMVWGLGIILIELLGYRIDIFNWNIIKNELTSNITERINDIILISNMNQYTLNNQTSDIIFGKMLSTDPDNRPTLDEIHIAFKSI